MANKKRSDLVIKVSPEEVIGSEIGKSGDYSYAHMSAKIGDDEYMHISYEWSGQNVPTFVLDIMGWMQSNKEVIDEQKEKFAKEYNELKNKA